MTKEEIITNVKAYVEMCFEDALKYGNKNDAHICLRHAFGAIDFTLNYLLADYDIDFAKWWMDYRKKFYELF